MADRDKEPTTLTLFAAIVIGLIIWSLALWGLADLTAGGSPEEVADFESERSE